MATMKAPPYLHHSIKTAGGTYTRTSIDAVMVAPHEQYQTYAEWKAYAASGPQAYKFIVTGNYTGSLPYTGGGLYPAVMTLEPDLRPWHEVWAYDLGLILAEGPPVDVGFYSKTTWGNSPWDLEIRHVWQAHKSQHPANLVKAAAEDAAWYETTKAVKKHFAFSPEYIAAHPF